MKQLSSLILALAVVGVGVGHAEYHTNVITTPGGAFAYSVDGGPTTNPTIELRAGVTNILDVRTSAFHPVVVTRTPVISDLYSGASPQNVNAQAIALTTPSSGFPTTLYYVCSFHGFFGEIHLQGLESPPPPNTILEVHVGTNIVMTSTGTTTSWLLVPEFSSNLLAGTWAPVPSYTNRFANGINTTAFNRLEPICGPNVFLRLRQQAR